MLARRNEQPTLLTGSYNNPAMLSDWMNAIFNDAFNWNSGTWLPDLNVSETDKMFEVTVELPGMNKDDIHVGLDDNILTISGERNIVTDENGRRFHRVESRFGSFNRRLPLPNVIDSEKVDATYENGILNVRIPKSKEKAGRRIKIS